MKIEENVLVHVIVTNVYHGNVIFESSKRGQDARVSEHRPATLNKFQMLLVDLYVV